MKLVLHTVFLFFNDGTDRIISVFKKLNMNAGNNTLTSGKILNRKRVSNMERKSSEPVKKEEKHSEVSRRVYKEEENEKVSYLSGSF